MHSIWAIASNTIKQALRMKIALVFIVLLMVLLPAMGLMTTGDGTIKGRLQTFVSYGLSLTALLLSLLTIIVSTYSVTSDIEQRQIYTVMTKPIRRFQFLLGKLLGVIMLDLALLVVFSAVIYSVTIYLPKLTDAADSETVQLDNEFFTARGSLTPTEADVTKEVRSTYERLDKSGQLPQDVLHNSVARKNYLTALTKQIKLSKRAAGAGRELIWEFENIKPIDPDRSLFIRFKFDVTDTPPDHSISSKWLIGDYRQVRYGIVLDTPIYNIDRKDLIRTFHEIEVPAKVVAEDGYLAVGFLNAPVNNTVVIFPPEDGLEVLYKADTFTGNFIRAALLIFFRLLFLACLGTLTATFLSFPVAILFCMAVFCTGTISGFVIYSFDYLGETTSELYQYTIKPLVKLLPQFDKFNPGKFLVPAKLISWPLIAKAFTIMVCIKGLLLLLLGLLIFSFKELAKVTV